MFNKLLKKLTYIVMKSVYWIVVLLAAALVAVSVRLATASGHGEEEAAAGVDASAAALECIMTRTSVRSYTDAAVPDSVVEKLLRAGMAAPSAANQQPWEFVVITEDAIKDSIASSFKWAKMTKDAPLAIVVCGDMDNLMKDDQTFGGFWTLDCSAVSENMLLAAHAMGLGGVWCGVYPVKEREETLRAILNLPANLSPLSLLVFGYPEAKGTPKDKWKPERIHYNRFD